MDEAWPYILPDTRDGGGWPVEVRVSSEIFVQYLGVGLLLVKREDVVEVDQAFILTDGVEDIFMGDWFIFLWKMSIIKRLPIGGVRINASF